MNINNIIGPRVLPGRFDFSKGINLVRVAAGLFYVPHVLFKLNGIAGAEKFFGSVGLKPALFFVILALITESLSAIGLTFGLYARWSGLLSAGCLLVASYATIVSHGLGWYWSGGGIEYLVMWAIISLAVSISAFKSGQ
jgi:putative oxidoreductase